MKRWLLKRTKIDTAAMARDLGIRRATAAVLANRELSSRQAARSFLYGGTAALGNPLEMKDFSAGSLSACGSDSRRKENCRVWRL